MGIEKMRNNIIKLILSFAGLFLVTILGTGMKVYGATVTYDVNTVVTATGVKDGKSFSTQWSHIYVDGVDAFCVEPLVPISSSSVSGYEGNPAGGNLPRKTVLALSIWKGTLGTSTESRHIAQAVVWETLEGSNKAVVNHIAGISDSRLAEQKKKLLDAITNYDLKPSFHKSKQKLVLGKEIEIKNTDSKVTLKDFDKESVNTGKLTTRVVGESLFVKATDVKQKDGVLSYRKSYQEGTPYVYNKTGEQAVAIGKINDPNAYLMNFDIETTGEIELVKLDVNTNKPVPNTKLKVTFSGDLAPKEQVVTTDKDGKVIIKDVPHGVKYEVQEIEVPAPYVLSSALGGSDIQKGTVTAGVTITTTFKNDYAKGKVVVNKLGAESKDQLWNSNYTLAGNTFELREDAEDGKVVGTAISDAKGRAEFKPVALKSNKDVYYVVETKASNGFLNTFKPQKVELVYKDNKTPVVEVEIAGDNQEVVGETTLLKQDAETGNDTQGKASFEGAEYALYHADGNVYQWNENFKPVLLEGTKVEGSEEIKVVIDSKTNKAKVGHLALEKGSYWQETKAPEGYQKDPTKHVVDFIYKDEQTAVIATDVVSKENVIKFDFEGFKKVSSKNGSTQTGVNDVPFSWTPQDPTKGERKDDVTKSQDGEDGYISFLGNPYGDYRLEEEKAPEGFEKIEPLIFESSYDKEKDVYQFKVTEEGQDEPIKVVKVPAKDIHEGSNVIKLSKFYLLDDAVQPEPAELESLFRTVDKKEELANKEDDETVDKSVLKANKEYQTIDVNKDQDLKEILWNKVGKEKVGKDLYYLTQFHKTDVHGNSEIVGEVKTAKKISKEEFIMEVPFEYKAKTLKVGEKLVATQIVYHDKDYKKEYARHFDLDNKKQTITGVETGEPKIETLFLIKGDKEETQSSDDKGTTSSTEETKKSKKPAESTEETTESSVGESTTEETTEEQVIDIAKDHSTVDYVYNEVLPSAVGSELYYVTEFHKVDENDKSLGILETVESTQKVEKEKFEFEIPFEYKANMIKANEKIVATHIAYSDKEHKQEYAKHFDLSNKKQTIIPAEMKQPKIETLFVTVKDNVQKINPFEDTPLVDKVHNELTAEVVGTELYYVTEFHRVDSSDKSLGILETVESTQKVEKEVFDFDVPFEYKKDSIKEGEKIVATHVVYSDKEHKREYARHYDLSNEKQTIVAEPQTILKKTLPTTGEDVMNLFIYGAIGMVGLIGIQYFRERKKKNVFETIGSNDDQNNEDATE